MSDPQNTASEPKPDSTAAGRGRGGRRRGRRLLVGGVAVLALLLGAAGAARAWEGHHHGMWSMRDGIPVTQVEHHIDHMLQKADATPDQVARVNAIVEAAAHDIDPLRAQMSGTRAQAVALLEAPQIDRGAIEHLRAERVATMDQVSQRLAKAVADAAEVLTPEQRAKLGHVFAEFGQHEPN